MQQIQKKQTIYKLNDQIDKLTKQVKQLEEGKGIEVKEVKKRKVIEESIRENQQLKVDPDDPFNDITDQESFDPIDLSKLQLMAKKFPKDYVQKLEFLVIQRDQAYQR